jgi:LppX_LprAFG lipoprotein
MRALVLLLAALALGSAACGSESAAGPAPEDAVALAASNTTDAGTYKADVTGSTEIAGQTVDVSGTGEFDGKSRQGHMSLTTSVAGQDIDMELVSVFPLVYIRYPPGLLPGLSAEKPWVKLDLEQLGEQVGLDLGQLVQAGQSDPSQGLQFLRGVSDVESVGEEEVRGVPTTHYTGTVDLRSRSETDPALEDTIEQLIQQTGISEVPVEVWIDEDNFVRRMKQTMEGATAGPGMTMDMTTTTELYDFGTDITVEEPPAGKVIDLQDLLQPS